MLNREGIEETGQDLYKTINGIAEGFFRDKGSRFLSFASPAQTTDQAERFLEQIKAKYHDARHVCFAWVIDQTGKSVRYSDAGEPAGTAGKPILSQIQAFDLHDIVVVVVRYFGGILLGTGGLSRAYREAARNCLQNATIINKVVGKEFTVSFPYSAEGILNRLFQEEQVIVVRKEFESQCVFRVLVPKSKEEKFLLRIGKIKDITVEAE